MSQKTLNLCLERYNFVKFGETTKSSHTVLCINNAYSVNSDKYRLTPAAIASKHGEGYVFTLNYDFDRPLFTIVQKSYALDGTSGNIVFEGIDPISKGGSKYLRKVTVSPVKLSDGSYLLEVTNDEYLRIGTTGAALGDEDLESLNEKIVATGGIEKSVETVGGKQVLKLDASGSAGAKEIVYFDVDPSDPPSGIYEAIGEALANNKEPVIRNDGAVYFYSSTGTDKYVFVGGYDTDVVNYTTVTVSDNDSVVKETVDTIEGMVFPLYYHSNDGGFTVADKTGHALTKTEIADAYRAGQIFMFSSYPASNTQAHWGYCCDINIESDNTGYAEFFILAAFGGDSYEWEKYRINLSSGTEFVTLWGPNTSYSTGYSGSYANASDVTALQSQVSSLSNVSAYTVKGEATVAQLNAGPSGIQAGWAYQLTDSGMLTDGTLAVVAGDTVAWDGTKWFPLVKSDYYATKTYAQNVAHSIAPEFDPTRDSEHAYKAGETVMYTDGNAYTFKVDHYGPWSAADVRNYVVSDEIESNSHFLDKLTVINPRISDGVIGADGVVNAAGPSAQKYTDFIRVKQGDVIRVTQRLTSAEHIWIAYAKYDSEGSFIERVILQNDVSDTIYDGTFVIGSGVAYVRVTYATYDVATTAIYKVTDIGSIDNEAIFASFANPSRLGVACDYGYFDSSNGNISRSLNKNRAVIGYVHLGKGSLVRVEDGTVGVAGFAVVVYNDKTGEYDSTIGNVVNNKTQITIIKDGICVIVVNTTEDDVSASLDILDKQVFIKKSTPAEQFIDFESTKDNGSINGSTGAVSESTTRVYTKDFVLLGAGSVIYFPSVSQRYGVFLYSKDKGIYSSLPSWRNLPCYQLTEDAYVRIHAEYDVPKSTTPEEIQIKVKPVASNNLTLPSYYFTDDYIANKIASISTHDSDCGYNGDSFVFITDTHWDSNCKQSPALIEYIKSKTTIHNVVFGGDAITNYESKDEAKAAYNKYRDVMKSCREYGWRPIIGNHEFNNPGADASKLPITLSKSEAYALVSGENTPITHVIDEYSGYWDNDLAKIRYIYVGCGYTSQIPSSVSSNVIAALDALPTGYKVFVFSHVGLTTDVTPTIASSLQSIIDKLDTMQADNKVIGVLTGHRHFDGSLRTAAGTIIIATTCDAMIENPNGLTRTRKSVTEQAFDVVQIDMTNEKIYLTRIGAGSNREFGFQSDE